MDEDNEVKDKNLEEKTDKIIFIKKALSTDEEDENNEATETSIEDEDNVEKMKRVEETGKKKTRKSKAKKWCIKKSKGNKCKNRKDNQVYNISSLLYIHSYKFIVRVFIGVTNVQTRLNGGQIFSVMSRISTEKKVEFIAIAAVKFLQMFTRVHCTERT